MTRRNLLSDPCWQGCDLGHPLPDATHAVSVALPRWRDVVAYEEPADLLEIAPTFVGASAARVAWLRPLRPL